MGHETGSRDFETRHEREYEKLRAGRDLNPADEAILRTFAGLVVRVHEARKELEFDGAVMSTEKGLVTHPAVDVEIKASAEMRGWVQRRPDLFGEQENKTATIRKFRAPNVA